MLHLGIYIYTHTHKKFYSPQDCKREVCYLQSPPFILVTKEIYGYFTLLICSVYVCPIYFNCFIIFL